MISGGSSSGSAVSVALGMAAFSLGTDTAGSGRVPAMLNTLVGFKPSLGAWSTSGVVPACASFDCVTVFANSLEDTEIVNQYAKGYDTECVWSKEYEDKGKKLPEKIYLPLEEPVFFGDNADVHKAKWYSATERIKKLGVKVEYIDYKMFYDAALILYDGAYVAERWADLKEFVSENEDKVFPVTKKILQSGGTEEKTAARLFEDLHMLQYYRHKAKEILKNAGKDGSAKLVAAMAQAKISGTLSTEAQAGMESFLKGFSGLDEKTKETWSQAWYGALEGLEGFETLVDPAEQGADAFLQSLITTLDVHSPSRAVKEIFSYVWPGAVEGLNEGQEELTSSGTGVISRLLDAMRGSVGDTKEIGSGLMTSFNEGIGSQLSVSEQQGKANAEAAKRGAGAVDPTSTGSAFGRFFDTAIGSFVGKLLTRGKGLADSAKRGAGSVNPGSTGKSFGTAYSSAVGSKAGDARAKGTSLATSAKSGAGSINSYDTGSNFGSGFVRGIGDWVGKAASKAAEMASTAYEKVKSVLGIHSPSKVMRGAGRFSGKGFALGIDDQIPAVKKASERMARSALNSLDMADLSNRVREAMAVNTNRITSSFALQSTEKIINQQSVQSTMRISDEDLTQLATKVGNATAAGVKKMQSRPVYLGTTRLDRELPKGAVPKI